LKINIQEYQDIYNIDDAIDKLFTNIKKTPRLQEALDFSTNAHKEQYRKSGEAYIVHPILVASLVAEITADEDMCISALLHDVVEDTTHKIEDIQQIFGNDVSCMVDGLTKIDYLQKNHISCDYDDNYDKVKLQSMHSALNLRKVFFQESHNEKVFTIKLCDRLHNLATLDALREEKQKRIAQESLIIYSPIAHRLGISEIKNLIEDLSFKYINNEVYMKIKDYLDNDTHIENMDLFLQQLRDKLEKNGFDKKNITINSRKKHIYSTHIKMQKDGIPVNEVLDIFAIRIITQNRLQCYKILGIIHNHFKPIISKFKDYVSLPKENGYQTIHTTVLSEFATYEIQIRTKDMHQNAEHGIAAHWKYKIDCAAPNLNWFKNLEYKNSEISEFNDLVFNDLYTETVEVFSPKGKVFSLPRGSISLDFAYAIHSDIGNSANEAIINGMKSSLLQEIHSGDIINIKVKDEIQYHCTWVDMVQTSKAKKYIKYICHHRLKKKNIQNAYNILTTFFNQKQKNIEDILKNNKKIYDHIEYISYNLDSFKNATSIIKNHLSIKPRFLFFDNFTHYSIKQSNINNFIIYHIKTIKEIQISHCCRAKIGDNIVGFLENNKVIVHHKMCIEASSLILEEKPSVFIQWDIINIKKYSMKIKLSHKTKSLASILSFMASIQAEVLSIKLNEKYTQNKEEYCKIKFNSKIEKYTIQNKFKNKGYFIRQFKMLDYQRKKY
jgi:RelA/SpoT family (p)ppGpp synthetase